MSSRLEEIIEQVKQNPRLIIAEDYEICVQDLRSSSRKFYNGDEISSATESNLWVGLRILHRKRPGKSMAFAVDKLSLARLVETAFQSAESSTADLWFRFPIWKPSLRNDDRVGQPLAATVNPGSPSLYQKLRHLPDVLEETYEDWNVDTRIFRKGEKYRLSYCKQIEALHFSLLNHYADNYYWVKEERAFSRRMEEKEQWLEELLKRSFGLQASRRFQGIESGELVLGPAASALLLKRIAPWFSAERTQTGKSPFREMGERIGGTAITLIDDGNYPGGVQSAPFDLEGSATQKTTLVEKGELRDLLYDTYWATRQNRISTGNFGRYPQSFFPRIAPTNLYIAPGRFSPQALLSSISRGAIIENIENVELVAGSDELVVRGSGWTVERGVKFEPVRGISFRLNALEFLRRAVSAASDLNFFGGFGAPSILFENIPLGLGRSDP